MFKKKCFKCDKKIEREYEFCPFCGFDLKKEEDKRDFGLLGKEDSLDANNLFNMPFNNESVFDKMIKSTMKMIQNEMGKQNSEKDENLNFQIFINGKKVNLSPKPVKEEKIIKLKINEEKIQKSVNLPREEAETKLTRLSNKIIYEINIPGVTDINDIIINQLESTIEIKAFSDDKVYTKNLPSLPIQKYGFSEGKLVLELNPNF